MAARASSSKPKQQPDAPVLLVGAGPGEATCGILYLASFLRRNGVEAFVRVYDNDTSEAEIERSLSQLLAHLRPRLVGISLKWFHHVHRAVVMARVLRRLAPQVKVVLGGNTASYFWRELAAYDCVDHVVLGDGEVPLLSLCRGEANPPNVVTRDASGKPQRLPLQYVQGAGSSEVHYSHFSQLFLSQQDLSAFSGWVAPGKGCGENCVYCGGGRGVQAASFGRAKSFLRSVATVRRDHRELAPNVWQYRFDFGGGSAPYLERIWGGLDLKRHSTTYFLWGAPPKPLIELLSRTFRRVYLVLDIGCFAESQRTELMGRGLLKPCPTDAQLLEAIAACRQFPNLELEVCGIYGLPFATTRTLAQERKQVERLIADGCTVSGQRLESQPGALVTEHAGRFGMVSEARTFSEFLDYFAEHDVATDGTVPMVRYLDRKLEQAVQRGCDELQQASAEQAASRELVPDQDTRLVTSLSSTTQVPLGAWLGNHRVPARLAKEPVTVVRALDGAGLACTPGLDERRFEDPLLQQGPGGAAILAALECFKRPVTMQVGVGQLKKRAKLDVDSALELVEGLVAGHFLARA